MGFELEKQVETFEKFYNSLVKDGDFFCTMNQKLKNAMTTYFIFLKKCI